MRWPVLLALFALAATGMAQDLTVLTYNIRYDNAGDSLDRWDLRKDALAEEVLKHKPQVIGLQEALAHQLSYLNGQWPGYERFGVGRDDGAAKGEFSPVYYDTTAFALLSGRTLWLSETPARPSKGWDAACERIATLVTLRDKRTGDSLLVVNSHWDHVGIEARTHSAELLLSELHPARRNGVRVILMGDFNATANDSATLYLAEHLLDACPKEHDGEGTFNGFELEPKAPKRIDYVWLSPGNWSVLGYEVPHPKVKGRQVSDHYPVVVRIRANE